MEEDKYTISIQPAQRDNKNVEFCDALFCLVSHYDSLLSKEEVENCLNFVRTNNSIYPRCDIMNCYTIDELLPNWRSVPSGRVFELANNNLKEEYKSQPHAILKGQELKEGEIAPVGTACEWLLCECPLTAKNCADCLSDKVKISRCDAEIWWRDIASKLNSN